MTRRVRLFGGANRRQTPGRGKLLPAEVKGPDVDQGGLENANPFSLRDQWFESISLLRGVCEPSVPKRRSPVCPQCAETAAQSQITTRNRRDTLHISTDFFAGGHGGKRDTSSSPCFRSGEARRQASRTGSGPNWTIGTVFVARSRLGARQCRYHRSHLVWVWGFSAQCPQAIDLLTLKRCRSGERPHHERDHANRITQ